MWWVLRPWPRPSSGWASALPLNLPKRRGERKIVSSGDWVWSVGAQSSAAGDQPDTSGEHLIARVRECLAAGPCRFHVLVPATPPSDHAWTEAEARALAQARLDSSLARFHKLGADVQGAVGDKDPMLAIEDILRTERFDEIILSTLPPGISKWLKKDLPRRVADRFGLPLTHLIGTPEPVLTRDEPDA